MLLTIRDRKLWTVIIVHVLKGCRSINIQKNKMLGLENKELSPKINVAVN